MCDPLFSNKPVDKARVMKILRIGGAYCGRGSAFKLRGPFMALAIRDQSAKHQCEFTSDRPIAPHSTLSRWDELRLLTQNGALRSVKTELHLDTKNCMR